MSDDSVEFGGFGPTTPAQSIIKPKPSKPRARTTARPLTKQKEIGLNSDPGPSKRPSGNGTHKQAKRKKVDQNILVPSEDDRETVGSSVQEVETGETRAVVGNVIASSDEDEMRTEVEKQLNGNGTKTRGRVNERTKQQQQRAKPSSSSKKQLKVSKKAGSEEENAEDVVLVEVPPSRESRTRKPGTKIEKATAEKDGNQAKKEETFMDVDEFLEGQDGIFALTDKLERPAEKTSLADGGMSSNKKHKELATLKEKIQQLESDNKALLSQMEELCRIRETEAEALMRRSEEEYEARIRALEEVNYFLKEQLVKKQPLAGIGRSSVLGFVTRDAADAEKQVLEKEMAKLKGELDDALKKSALREQEIGKMKQTEKELRIDLQAEIERANSLAKQAHRHPQPTPRSGIIAEDPKHREAIKLYEDLTNIIVLNIRSSPGGRGKKDEWQFTCCYTHTNETDSVDPVTRSLSFTLRSYEQPDDDGHLRDWVQYLPTSVDKEAEDFRVQLDFLNSPFQFERNQLALFLRTLYTTIEDIVKASNNGDDGEGGEEVQEQTG